MKKNLKLIMLLCWFITIPAQANEVLIKPFAYPNDLTITPLNSSNQTFTPDANKKYLVNFWASWCVPCITELKNFIPLADDLADKGINLVLVNVDRRPHTAIPKFMKKIGLNYADFYVADMYDVLQHFDSSGLPITVAVQDKMVLFRYDYSRIVWNDTLLTTITSGFKN